jgi:flagellar basal body-associated protein FliL
MKSKTWFTLSAISTFWMFLTTLLYASIASVLLFGTSEGKEMIRKFVMDELNTHFIMIMSTGCIIAISIVSSFILLLSKQSDKLDRLDEETEKYYKARRRLEEKINKL